MGSVSGVRWCCACGSAGVTEAGAKAAPAANSAEVWYFKLLCGPYCDVLDGQNLIDRRSPQRALQSAIGVEREHDLIAIRGKPLLLTGVTSVFLHDFPTNQPV